MARRRSTKYSPSAAHSIKEDTRAPRIAARTSSPARARAAAAAKSIAAIEGGFEGKVPLRKVWEDGEHLKMEEVEGKKGWRCMWCNHFFIGVNHTKALQHVSKMWSPNVHVSLCSATIPEEYLNWYRDLFARKVAKKKMKREAEKKVESAIEDNHDATEDLAAERRTRKKPRIHQSVATSPEVEIVSTSRQTTLPSKVSPRQSKVLESNEAACDIAIARLVHVMNLPFNFAESSLFKKVIFHARMTSGDYAAPSRYAIGGPLLDAHFKQVSEKNKQDLLREVEVFGLSVLGDGATIKKRPLFNVLASGFYSPATVLGICDCSSHLAKGGKKDAEYIAKLFLPHMQKLDPKKNNLDAYIVDGASNVQKAGQVIEAVFPRVSVFHGAEHCLSLFFSDIAKIPEVKELVLKTKRMYRVFGSGSFHVPHAMFMKEAASGNNGRSINLLRAVETRMAGYFYAMHRALRLKPALEATVHSTAWKNLKRNDPIIKRAASDIKDADHWQRLYILLRALWPVLKLLRISDSNKPGMDKIVYLVNRARKALENSTEFLSDSKLFGEVDKAELSAIAVDGEDDDDDSDDDLSVDAEDEEQETGDDNEELFLSDRLLSIFDRRTDKTLVHGFSVTAWILSVDPDIRADVKARFSKTIHEPLVEEVITKLYTHDPTVQIHEVIHGFWQQWKHFKLETGPYEKRSMWNVSDARLGNSAEWHSHYSHDRDDTRILGYIACRVTSKVIGMGAAERSWGDTKSIMTNQRLKMTSQKTEKLAIISTSTKLSNARIERQALEKADSEGKRALWGDEDENFDLQLEQFGVNVETIAKKQDPKTPKRLFKCWIEDWEKKILKKNDAVSKMKLLQKYGGLLMQDIDNDNREYVISPEKMQFERGKNGGWAVLAEPPEYDGDNDEVLEPFQINEETLIYLIKNTIQPKHIQVKFVEVEV